MSGFDINTVTISGNLVANPELRSLQSGTSVCSARIAHNERRKTQSGEWVDVPAYFDITIWGGLGEWVETNLTKGQKVTVAGRLSWREFEVNQGTEKKPDMKKRERVSITAQSIVPAGKSTAATPDDRDFASFTPVGDDDIPF